MKQPELGKKLADIRKQKGITQEELVARCNVTVRTIQRIESGEVMPRPSTLKLIVEALEYDWNSFSPEINSSANNSRNWLARFFSLNPSFYADSKAISGELQMAWVAGILYFILGFPESFFEITMLESDFFSAGETGFIIIKVLVLISFVFFIRGFIILGHRQKSKLMLFSAYLYLCVLFIDYSIDIVLVGFWSYDLDELMIGKALMYGATAVAFGAGLLRLRESLGRAAEFAGILEIVIGIAFLSVILFMAGFILMIPAEILEIYILFKYSESLKISAAETDFKFSNASSSENP
jgi:transcriptional regulator with XRE-family HTH domain